MKKIVLKIEGMTCSACSSGLEKYLNKQKEIQTANVNLVLSIATIEYDNCSKNKLEKYIEEAGFKSKGEFKGIEENKTKKSDKIKFIGLGIFLLFLMYVSMGHMLKLPEFFLLNKEHPITLSTFQLLSACLFILYGFPILKSGIKNSIHRMPNMDTLVMLSVEVSFFYSFYRYLQILNGEVMYLHSLYFESICMVIYFMKLGRFLEEKSKNKTKEAIQKLVQITPSTATLKIGKEEKQVSIDEVKQNDILLCKTGEKIAVDGVVVKGSTYVDESFITGESKPVLKEEGSKVIAGSISYDGYIEYKAQKIGKESTISKIVKLVIEATNTKNKMQKLADKLSGYFVPFILILSLITFLLQWILNGNLEKAILHAITILVVACPCALGLAVPLVVVVASGLCAKKGLFLKESEALEKGRMIDTIVFDKTGTLTVGKLNVFQVYNYSTLKNQELLNLVANIESFSSHPIRTAFSVSEELEVQNYKTLNGLGISGKVKNKVYHIGNEKLLEKYHISDIHQKDYDALVGNGCSILYVVEEKEVIGLIGVRDIVRKEMREVIQKLKKEKIDVIMLTGDNKMTAEIVAKELGIQEVIASVLPNKKAQEIQKLIQKGKKVMMVGDGINDAPALVSSTVGVSISDGTDIAADASSVILMNNDMHNLLDFIKISKRSYKVMVENLFWAFLYNLCMLPIAMGLFEDSGITITPMLGSIAMIISSLTVVMNALRFGRVRK